MIESATDGNDNQSANIKDPIFICSLFFIYLFGAHSLFPNSVLQTGEHNFIMSDLVFLVFE